MFMFGTSGMMGFVRLAAVVAAALGRSLGFTVVTGVLLTGFEEPAAN